MVTLIENLWTISEQSHYKSDEKSKLVAENQRLIEEAKTVSTQLAETQDSLQKEMKKSKSRSQSSGSRDQVTLITLESPSDNPRIL